MEKVKEMKERLLKDEDLHRVGIQVLVKGVHLSAHMLLSSKCI